jgi:hypothetical protein
MMLPELQDDYRTKKDEWLNFDEKQLVFPSPDEIDKMKLQTDFFNIDEFHDLNVERLK